MDRPGLEIRLRLLIRQSFASTQQDGGRQPVGSHRSSTARVVWPASGCIEPILGDHELRRATRTTHSGAELRMRANCRSARAWRREIELARIKRRRGPCQLAEHPQRVAGMDAQQDVPPPRAGRRRSPAAISGRREFPSPRPAAGYARQGNRPQRCRRRRGNALGRFARHRFDAGRRWFVRGVPRDFLAIKQKPVQMVPGRPANAAAANNNQAAASSCRRRQAHHQAASCRHPSTMRRKTMRSRRRRSIGPDRHTDRQPFPGPRRRTRPPAVGTEACALSPEAACVPQNEPMTNLGRGWVIRHRPCGGSYRAIHR